MTLSIVWQLVRGKASWTKPKTWSSPLIGWLGSEFYSHIDVVTPGGLLRGARSDTIKGIKPGYRDRPQNYEEWAACVRYELPVTEAQYAAYWTISDAKVGDPYDERGLIAAYIFGRKYNLWDERTDWVGWCSQEVALNAARAGIWDLDPNIQDVDPGGCVFLLLGKGARRTDMQPTTPAAPQSAAG